MMTKFFIKKTVYFILFSMIGYIGGYVIVDVFLNLKKAENTIFIWGDSQTYQGLNLVEIGRLTNKYIYSAAKHGSGLYDFLVFSEKVPKGANVIIGISKLTQLRPITNEFNRSGINLPSLITLYESRCYNNRDIKSIINNNKYPRKIFTSSTVLYSDFNQITNIQPLSFFEEKYSMKHPFLEERQKLYLLGIKNLKAKNCKIVFIEFPFHTTLNNLVIKSELNQNTEDFKLEVMHLFRKSEYDSINIHNSKPLMSDLTHLNEYGATLITGELIKKMNNNNGETTMYIINSGACE